MSTPATSKSRTSDRWAGDIRHCYADISRITALGYTPKVRFEDGIGELVSWVGAQAVGGSFEQARNELAQRGLTG